MTYKTYEDKYGRGLRLYRSTDDIARDVASVKERISDINAKLNPRVLLFGVMDDERLARDPCAFVRLLDDAMAKAEDALTELKGLYELLSELEDESKETLCRIRR